MTVPERQVGEHYTENARIESLQSVVNSFLDNLTRLAAICIVSDMCRNVIGMSVCGNLDTV